MVDEVMVDEVMVDEVMVDIDEVEDAAGGSDRRGGETRQRGLTTFDVAVPEDWRDLVGRDLQTYRAIATHLRRSLSVEQVEAGARLPSEAEFASKYGVSRMTMRSALGELAQEGLVERRPGVATFVAQKRYVRDFDRLSSFFEEVRASGGVPTSRLLSLTVGTASPEVREALGVSTREAVYHIRRLRMDSGSAVAVHDAYTPQLLCPGLDQEDLEHGSLYQLYRDRWLHRLGGAVQRLSARAATREEASLLAVGFKAPLISVSRRSWLQSGRILEFVVGVYRPDRYGFVVTLRPDPVR